MFEDWKTAWKQAVENFQRELDDDDEPPDLAQIGAMRRDVRAARAALDRLQMELERCRVELAEEQQQEEVCRRRGDMAAAIGDQTTVTIALQWAERHHQRAVILQQKTEVLAAELSMRRDDLKGMEDQVTQLQWDLNATVPPPSRPGPLPPRPERDKQDSDFRTLDRQARERAAEARLEELKKKMRPEPEPEA